MNDQNYSIKIAETHEEIRRCHPVMRQLRPNWGLDEFVSQVQLQIKEDSYKLAFLEEDGEVRAAAGFRLGNMLIRHKHMYVDDLVTDSRNRSRGYGRVLLGWLEQFARQNGCTRVDLDSGVQNVDAHRFYNREGFAKSSFHFVKKL
jgi:GNAT superfamily N-acetyltransferase